MRGEIWKDQMAPAMLCKRKAQTSTTKVAAKQEIASPKIPKTIWDCIVECHESTRQRVESSLPTKYEDRIAGRGFTSVIHDNLVHKFIPVPQAMKIPDAKAAVDREWKKLETIPAWELEEVKSKKEGGYSGSTTRQQEGPLCYTDGHLSPQERGVRTPIAKIHRQSRAPWWHCERRLWSPRSFVLNRARLRPKWLPRKWWMLLQDYQNVTDKQPTQVSAHIQVESEDAPRFLKIPRSECRDVWIRLPRHKWAQILVKHRRPSGSSWTNFFWTPISRIVVGKTIRGSSAGFWMGESTKLGLAVSSWKTRIILIGVRGWHEKWLERSRIWLPCGRNRWNMLIFTNQLHFLITYNWDALNVNVNRMKQSLNSIKKMF